MVIINNKLLDFISIRNIYILFICTINYKISLFRKFGVPCSNAEITEFWNKIFTDTIPKSSDLQSIFPLKYEVSP